LPRLNVIRAEPRLLEALPVHFQILPPPLGAGSRLPERRVLPRRVGGETPGAVGAPVVGQVAREDVLPVVELARPHRDRVIPPVPEIPLLELSGFPAEVPLLGVADAVGPVAEELGVPLGRTE